MTEPVVSITIALPLDQAWAFAQFLKRTGHSDYLHWTKDSDEAYQMLTAGEKIRIALAEAGVAPR
jgi:hypothetical protein